MEQFDNEYEYVERKPNPRARFNWLYIMPGLGAVWLLFLLCAAIFQIPVTDVVDPVMGTMILMFFVLGGLFFYALAPKSNR